MDGKTLEAKCLLASRCKKAGQAEFCNSLCFPYCKLHGQSGDGGVWSMAGIPKAYAHCTLGNIPFSADNPQAARAMRIYCADILQNVQEGLGFYLCAIPNRQNPRGTGTGKTTAACTILNEFLAARVIQHFRQVREIDEVPGLFVGVAKFQNLFNSQFRGPADMKNEASRRYYTFKARMIKTELLVLDDIGIRDATPAFLGEFFEIIDSRIADGRATIYTSNVPISTVAEKLDERIASRIEGSTETVAFEGEDKRRRGDL